MPYDTADAERSDRELTRAIGNLRPAMTKAVTIVADAIDSNFRSESDAGKRWAPLAPSTLAQRERKGYGPGPILQREGTLRTLASAHREVSESGAEVGPEGPDYAEYHLTGTPRMPARPFLDISELSVDAIDDAIHRHLAEHE